MECIDRADKYSIWQCKYCNYLTEEPGWYNPIIF